MPLEGWIKVSTFPLLLGCLVLLAKRAAAARPRFDSSTDMGLVLVPADAEIDSVIFRLRATDQDADFPLVFDITATVTPIVRIENLPCTLYNKVCQANVILTRRLIAGRLHDFAVRVKDSKGDSNSMQATISVTNATTQRDKIFPHIPAIIMVPEDTKPGKELDYVLVRSNQWSGKPVYIELWQPKELFTIRQRQTPAETRGVITLIGELDFETQSMYTLTIYATDPYTEPRKDTRNIAGLHLVVVVQDVQDVPPIFTLAPPLTKINNTVKPGDVILRVHAEDGDKGVPREVTYGLVSEGNPFTPFFNISETTGEIILARPLEELTQITHVGAPVVLTVVAEEIRRSTTEPPAQATVVEVGLLLGEPGNSPPFFDNDNYIAWMDENAEPGTVVTFTEHYSPKVHDEDIGKAGVFALKLENNNGTFEISPAVAERTANFVIIVRDNSLMDYEIHKSLRFKIIAQEVGPATNLSASVPATIFLRDVNDNPPEFEVSSYQVTLSENATAGTRVVQVHATDKDTGAFGRIQYTRIIGTGSDAFDLDSVTGIITVAMTTSALDRETTASLQLTVEARDEDGNGLRGIVPLIVNLLDVNDNAPIFEMESYRFTLNEDLTNFTNPAIIKAFDADAEPPNNQVRYEIIHGNYDNKFYIDEITGELFLREPINKVRRTRHNNYQNFAAIFRNGLDKVHKSFEKMLPSSTIAPENVTSQVANTNETFDDAAEENSSIRRKREDEQILFTLTARAYDLGVPHLSGMTQISVLRGPVAGARIVMFVVSGENPDPVKTAETLAAITGGRITVLEIRPFTSSDIPGGTAMNVPSLEGGKKSIVVARVEPNGGRTSLVDIERIRAALAANGVGVIDGDMSTAKPGTTNHNTNTNVNSSTSVSSEQVTVYRAENRLLFWLLIILGLLMLIALIALIICCICPACPFYMAPRKRRVHSSETLIARSDGRPRRHLHRKHGRFLEASWSGKKQAWSADPMRRNWQFNRRNQKAGGLASLPGDVHIVERDHEISEKAGSLHLRDGHVPVYFTEPRPVEERIYIEDIEGGRGYGHVDVETMQRQHDVERGSDVGGRRTYVNEQDEQRAREQQAKFVREQHFYRDGNAEVLRLVTRGQIIDEQHRPQILTIDQAQAEGYRVDGKDILLQRFIEDQNIRHDAGQELHESLQDIERRSMESHHRQKEAVNIQPKVLLIPERLEQDHRQHIEQLGPDVQRLIIDHGSFDKTAAARFETKDSQEMMQSATLLMQAPAVPKVLGEKSKEQTSRQSVNLSHYSLHDLELARQNALLTRLLLERDVREVGGGGGGGLMVDSASYLETQSLPGQVAIATQTDRTAATQTELPSRSRSDNDESEEDARMRRKMKSKKRHGDGEPRRIRTLWVKSPIQEEDVQYRTEKRSNTVRKKIKDIKDSRRISLEPEVLQAISDSLDENGQVPITARRRDVAPEDSNSREEGGEENVGLEDSSSVEHVFQDGRRIIPEKRQDTTGVSDDEVKIKSHKGKRGNTVEPSFRILEREMSSLSKKLSKLAGKKILQYSNGSETDSHDQMKTAPADAKKTEVKLETPVGDGKNIAKRVQVTKSKRSKSTSQSAKVSDTPSTKEQVVGELKTRHISKYRKMQTISTGSSDFEETVEKTKKQGSTVTHAEKQKQAPSKAPLAKLKRQNKVEHKDLPPRTALLTLPQETLQQKDSSDTASKGSVKSGKSERDSMRMKKSSSSISGGKTMSSSPGASDNSKDTKTKKKARPVQDAGKSSAATSEASGKVSPAETVPSVKSDAKDSIESTVIEIEAKTPQAARLKMNIVPEAVEMIERVPTPIPTLGIHEHNITVVPEHVLEKDKSERTLTPVPSPEAPGTNIKVVSETVKSPIFRAKSVPSSEVSDSSVKIVPEMADLEKSKDSQDAENAAMETAITSPKISEEPTELINEPISIPKEELIDFLRHEMKDSMQSLQADGHLMATKAVATVTDMIVGSVGLRSEDEANSQGNEELPKPIELIGSEQVDEWKQIPADTVSHPEDKTDKSAVVAQQSEDAAATFSDNFDSFCGTDVLVKDSSETRSAAGEFSYETLESESSGEPHSPIKDTNGKDAAAKPTEIKVAPVVPTISHQEKTEEPQIAATETLSLSPSVEDSSDFAEQPISRPATPVPPELPPSEGDIHVSLPGAIEGSVPTMETDTTIPVQVSLDISKHVPESITVSKLEQLASSTVQVDIDQVPNVPPLDITRLDEKIVISQEPTESKSEESEISVTCSPISSQKIVILQEPTESNSNESDSPIAPQKIIISQEPTESNANESDSPIAPQKIIISQEPTESNSNESEISVTRSPLAPQKNIISQEPTESNSKESEINNTRPPLASPTLEEMKLETASQKEFGIADSLFVDAKLLKVSPRSESNIIIDTDVKKSQQEKIDDDIDKSIDNRVSPVNLVELSRAMLDDGDDSDSSEASSKTMLTARPYGTPRHRAISSAVETVEALAASEIEPAVSESTKDLLATDVSIEISPATPETVESMQSLDNLDEEPVIDEPEEKECEKFSEIERKTTGSASERIGEEAIASATRDTSPAMHPPSVTAIRAAEEDVREKESQSQDQSKMLDGTASPEQDQKTDASDKVQLSQIRQQQLPADADGFASLTETDEPVKSLDISERSEQVTNLPGIRKGAVIEKVVKATGAKTLPSTGKETKRVVKKRVPSSEDVSRGTKKAAAVPAKTPSSQKQAKTKTLKEESSIIGKQSTVIGQFVRSRDTKRQTPSGESQGEQQADKSRRTWRKNDRPEKNVSQQDKPKSDGKVMTSKRPPTESRVKIEKLKDSRVKKLAETTGKVDKTMKSVPDGTKVAQAVKSEPVQDQQIVDEQVEKAKKDDEGIADVVDQQEQTESLPIQDTEPSIQSSPVLVDDSKIQDSGTTDAEQELPQQSSDVLVELKSDLDNLVEKTAESQLQETLVKDSREEEATTAEVLVESSEKNEAEKIDELPVASEQSDKAVESDNVNKDSQEDKTPIISETSVKSLAPEVPTAKTSSPRKAAKPRRETEMTVIESQSRYMEWYKQKREEMERKRQERKDTDEEEERPKWLRKSKRQRWFKAGPDEKRIFDPKIGETPPGRRKIKPLVNVESEQLKAIVRQGRKLRKAQGDRDDEPQILIFAPEKPPPSSIPPNSRYHHHHHLVQHSEYNYEKMPIAPFYLHPPPVPHSSPQHYEPLSPEQYQSLPSDSRRPAEGTTVQQQQQQQQQGSNKLRHQQLLEKKSVFDIAYSEAAPSQLRSDSTTPPS